MPATRATTIQQRQQIMELVQNGHSCAAIAQQLKLSYWTVRKWSRRTRSGDVSRLVTTNGRPPTGPLAAVPPLVRYLALRLKLKHPAWGAVYIVQQMRKHPHLQGVPLPHPSTVWRYWATFGERLTKRRQRQPKVSVGPVRAVHGLWQLDFKESVDVAGVGPTTISQARDAVGRATVLHRIHPAAQPGQRIVKLTTEQVQADCRHAFLEWGLPDAIQTDHASLFADDDPSPFPTRLKLWWLGLGIAHRLIQHGPQQNGSVERAHRTLVERTLTGQVFRDAAALQAQVDTDWQELNSECPSHARGCHGRPPLLAHPELCWPRRLYDPADELALFDLQRIDAYLVTLTWIRKVNSHGRLSLGSQRYGLGRSWAGKSVSIRYDPQGRTFLFTDLAKSALPTLSRAAKGLEKTDICGIIDVQAPARQLQFPFLTCYPLPVKAAA
jgi:transposase